MFFAHSRPGASASAIAWLQTISILVSLLTPVLTSHIKSPFTSLHHRKLQEPQQTSLWSHWNTISGFNFFDSFVFINRWDVCHFLPLILIFSQLKLI
jgi:hypothetical protein